MIFYPSSPIHDPGSLHCKGFHGPLIDPRLRLQAKEEWFSAWRDAKQGKRGADYEQLKKRFEDSVGS